MEKKKLPLAFWIFIGLIAGIVAGLYSFTISTLAKVAPIAFFKAMMPAMMIVIKALRGII